jgi:Asp-tRNA(Asn)/Glu-tRNA(Gln) amidotransferase A subunit family amidase
MMVQGAHYILGPLGEDSDLRRWGRKLAERGGKNAKKRAVAAVARKLAVLLHRLWVGGDAYHAEFMAKTPELYNSWTLERLRTGAEVTALAYIGGLRETSELRRSVRQMFGSVDALVTPTAPIPPRTILEANADPPTRSPVLDLRNTAPFDKNGLSTISIPCGFTSTGLPIGLQISGPPECEAVVLQLGHAYEETTEWRKRRPPTSLEALAEASPFSTKPAARLGGIFST